MNSRLQLIAIVALLAVSSPRVARSKILEDEMFDVALVVISEPYWDVSFKYDFDISGEVLGARNFIHHFFENLGVTDGKVRLAILNAYVKDGKEWIKVLHRLNEEPSPKRLEDTVYRMYPWERMGTRVARETLAEKVEKLVFNDEAKGDRSAVPNVICVLALDIKRNGWETDHAMFTEKIPLRFFVPTMAMMEVHVEETHYAYISSAYGDAVQTSAQSNNMFDPATYHQNVMKIGAERMVNMLKDLQRGCPKYTMDPLPCHFDRHDRCVREFNYHHGDRAQHPQFCLNGSMPVECESRKMCDDGCNKLQGENWSKCDCATGTQTKKYTKAGVAVKLVEYCPPPQQRSCECKAEAKLSKAAVIGIVCGVSGGVVLVTIVVVVVLIMRRRARMKRHGLQFTDASNVTTVAATTGLTQMGGASRMSQMTRAPSAVFSRQSQSATPKTAATKSRDGAKTPAATTRTTAATTRTTAVTKSRDVGGGTKTKAMSSRRR